MTEDYTLSTVPTALGFKATLEDVRSLITVIKAISFKERIMCVISSQGLRLIVEDSKSMQARAYLESKSFRDFTFPQRHTLTSSPEEVPELDENSSLVFAVPVQTLLNCLNIFGVSGTRAGDEGGYHYVNHSQDATCLDRGRIAVRMFCPIDGNEISFILEEKGVITVCKILTEEAEPLSDLPVIFGGSPVIGKVIMKSDWLRDAFSELDGTADTVTLYISPQAPFFRVAATGLAGDAQMDYPKDTDVIESFQCTKPALNTYRFKSLQPSLKALAVSSKTSIRVTDHGFLSLQFLVMLNDKDMTLVEYILSPESDAETG
ncbi:ssDNA endodeoxyribonuclease [Gaertneriomyces sp. JEL0708]|nr:ssDNA endodeoxyribonuclease [Gaertneriomyces sp. JEL0708]